MGGGWYHRPRYYGGGGGGCCGGMIGAMLVPIIVILMMVSAVFSMINVNVGDTVYWEDTNYSEEAFQDYANEQYEKEFGSSTAYEDNVLIVFLVNEDYYTYNYIAWVGDHVAKDINYMLGDNDTELGEAMAESISATNYKYSLDSDLSVVIDSMRKQILDLGLESSYDCDENHVQVQSHLTNHSDIPMTEDTVNTALELFTQETGIPVVIVVEDMTAVFGTNEQSTTVAVGSKVNLVTVLGVAVLVILVIVLIVILVRKKKNEGDGDFVNEEKNRQYGKFDDQYK